MAKVVSFGHISFYTHDIYARCQRLMDIGYTKLAR